LQPAKDSPDAPLPVLRLEDFAEDCLKLDAPAFSRKHGDAFLLHYGPVEGLTRPARPQKTVDRPDTPTAAGRPLPRLVDAQGACVVFQVRATGRGPYPSMITVGRARNNDIILADVSVSKFHAYFKEDGHRFFLQDAGSRNGTAIEGALVPKSKQGKPVEVMEGHEVRFANVRLRFLRGAGLRELAAKKAR
jgi:hypothetical protein